MSDVVQIPPVGTYNVVDGGLGIVKGNAIGWESCRETFHTRSDQIDSFLFYLKFDSGDVIKFMQVFQAACNCPQDQMVVIKKTTHERVLWVGMSPWWKYRARRSLLTALLRSGMNFTDNSSKGFLKALYSTEYLSATKYAVDAFLNGKNSFKLRRRDSFDGWQNFFEFRAHADTNAILIKLKRRGKGHVDKPRAASKNAGSRTRGRTKVAKGSSTSSH